MSKTGNYFWLFTAMYVRFIQNKLNKKNKKRDRQNYSQSQGLTWLSSYIISYLPTVQYECNWSAKKSCFSNDRGKCNVKVL